MAIRSWPSKSWNSKKANDVLACLTCSHVLPARARLVDCIIYASFCSRVICMLGCLLADSSFLPCSLCNIGSVAYRFWVGLLARSWKCGHAHTCGVCVQTSGGNLIPARDDHLATRRNLKPLPRRRGAVHEGSRGPRRVPYGGA